MEITVTVALCIVALDWAVRTYIVCSIIKHNTIFK